MTDHMDPYRTIRFELFEVWEDGKGEFPLFVCSDAVVIDEHLDEHPGDTVTRRWWTREGGQAAPRTPTVTLPCCRGEGACRAPSDIGPCAPFGTRYPPATGTGPDTRIRPGQIQP